MDTLRLAPIGRWRIPVFIGLQPQDWNSVGSEKGTKQEIRPIGLPPTKKSAHIPMLRLWRLPLPMWGKHLGTPTRWFNPLVCLSNQPKSAPSKYDRPKYASGPHRTSRILRNSVEQEAILTDTEWNVIQCVAMKRNYELISDKDRCMPIYHACVYIYI